MIEPGVAKKKKKSTPSEKVKQEEASNFNLQKLIGEDFKDIVKSHSLKEKSMFTRRKFQHFTN
jgi:hypothetical protein